MVLGLGSVTVGAFLADLMGNDTTRGFTRAAWATYVAVEINLPTTLGNLTGWIVDTAAALL